MGTVNIEYFVGVLYGESFSSTFIHGLIKIHGSCGWGGKVTLKELGYLKQDRMMGNACKDWARYA